MSRAHPRSRGENLIRRDHRRVLRGSSPLTRGKPVAGTANEPVGGLIPAHAGKTRALTQVSEHERAHPRSRGENPRTWTPTGPISGSSPLTRGKLAQQGATLAELRLIPAHAGKTHLGQRRGFSSRAHPRSRGENAPPRRGVSSTVGSSPLTRGKLSGGVVRRVRIGLIPAHAGKTSSASWRLTAWAAHPRSRGENVFGELEANRLGGSSPLTRGKQCCHRHALGTERLIPAHAGKTLGRRRATRARRAHPRSRGENPGCDTVRPRTAGSSPLTRGKRSGLRARALRRRLIPAHAGKTRCQRRSRDPDRAHPRSRGENERDVSLAAGFGGSSPLTRGKRQARRHEAHPRGLIPAHAGKTPPESHPWP